jgi:murein DD-endopeptidase MepM/ murein hydrolase activator NlpD
MFAVRFFLFQIVVVLLSFSGAFAEVVLVTEPKPVSRIELGPELRQESQIDLLYKKTHPGEVIPLQFTYPADTIANEIYCDGRKVSSFLAHGGLRFGYLAESYFSSKKSYKCQLKLGDERMVDIADIQVVDKDFPAEKLRVKQSKVHPSKKASLKISKEREFLARIYQNSAKVPLFEMPFIAPSNNKVTSIYGTKRVFNNKKQTQHLGTDFRAKVGSAIYGANTGRVVVAGNLFYTGKTVIIDHGLGIFTIYGHLSKIMVKEGDRVRQLQLIGLAGATGRATGPHLHWGVKVDGEFVDGYSLIAATGDLNRPVDANTASNQSPEKPKRWLAEKFRERPVNSL